MAGFEPATFCSQSRHATKLRYIPCYTNILYFNNPLPSIYKEKNFSLVFFFLSLKRNKKEIFSLQSEMLIVTLSNVKE